MISAGFAELVCPNGHACIYSSEVSSGLSFAEEERGGAGLGRLGMMHWGRHSVTQALLRHIGEVLAGQKQ